MRGKWETKRNLSRSIERNEREYTQQSQETSDQLQVGFFLLKRCLVFMDCNMWETAEFCKCSDGL